MSSTSKFGLSLVMVVLLLGLLAEAGAASPSVLPNGKVPGRIVIDEDIDLYALRLNLEAKGAEVIGLAPEGEVIVEVPPGRLQALGSVFGVKKVKEVEVIPEPEEEVTPEIRSMGVKAPDAERLAEIEEQTIQMDSLAPNALSQKRAALEGKGRGKALGKGKKNDGGFTPLGLPSSVDNSNSNYFPPIDSQGGQGSCSAWASCYYWATYTQAKDENKNASGGSTSVLCSPAWGYNLHNSGIDGGSWPDEIMIHMCQSGVCSWQLMPYNDSNYTNWPSEAAWVQALNNRTQSHYSIDGHTDLTNIKTYLSNGGLLVTTTDVYTNWNPTLINNYSRGVDSGVLFSHAGETLIGAHAMTIVGYDDNKSYYDGSTTQYGAFLIANSWGSGWGTTNTAGKRGFMWVAYDYFMEDNWCFGFGLHNSDRADYRPHLYAVSGLNHQERGRVGYRGGVGSDPDNPVWTSERALDYFGGYSVALTDSKRVAVDLTDGMSSVTDTSDVHLFVRLINKLPTSYNGTITSADFYHDFDEDGDFGVAYSSDPTVTVSPGSIGHATVNFNATTGNSVPKADAGGSRLVRVNDVVTFDGSGSSDADQDPLTFTWNFGDGSAVETGCTVTHIYTATGTYTVTLTVHDGTDPDTDTAEVTVLPELVPLDQWLQGSIHWHTTNSDGNASLADMISYYRDSAGHDFSCVADHDYISDADQYTSGGFLGVNGVEASAGGPHVVGFDMSSTGSYTPGSGLQGHINNILNESGLPMVAHPKWSKEYSGYDMVNLIKDMTGCQHVAVFNYYCDYNWSWGNSEAIWDEVLNSNKLVYGYAEDDAHGLGTVGRTYNMVGAAEPTTSSIRSAMNVGDYYACYSTTKGARGIELTGYDISGTDEGGVISIDTDYGETIKFIGSGGTVYKTVSSDQGSYTLDGTEGYIRVRITNTDGDTTWTQPIWVAGGPKPPPPIEEYEGYEPITTGGEGGQVKWVTSLSMWGAGGLGSVIDSLDGSPTIIKFSVGGTSWTGSAPRILKPNVTIAGETAPPPGFTIACSGYRGLEVNTHDVIVRHIRVRYAGGELIQVFGDYNIIIDHCSLTTCGDGACDVNNGTHHVIFSRNLIADAVECHRTYGEYAAFHHNLYTYNNRRQPKIVCWTGPFDFRNNVVELWTNTGTNCANEGAINVINNWYGPPAPTESWELGLMVQSVAQSTYVSGNYCEGDPDINSEGTQSYPNEQPDVTTIDAGPALWDDIHRNCGALPRDSIDEYWAGPAGNTPPVADAGPDQYAYEDDTVTFDGSGSYDVDNDSLTYTWDFGDGTNGTGVTPTHVYTVSGNYTVTLTVDDGEDSDTDTCQVEILPAGMPRANAGPDKMVHVNDPVTLDGSGSYDPDSDPLTYTWEFGDGGSATGCTVTHSYTATAVYTVTLTVDDGTYSDDDVCLVTARDNQEPVAVIDPTNQEIKVNTVATWDGSSSYDPDEDTLYYTWDLGDGTTAAGGVVTHTYTITGTYTVTLTVSDWYDSDTDKGTIVVHPNYPPEPDAGPDQIVNQYAVVGFDASNSEDANDDPLTFTWDFGDGFIATGTVTNHRYLDVGTYTVTLTASDGELSATDTCEVEVIDVHFDWYYVDAFLGDDNNDGSEGSPWKTIQKAFDTVSAGDAVLVKPGTYDGGNNHTLNSGSPAAPIIFKAATDEGRVIIDATGDSYGIRTTEHYVVIQGFTIHGSSGQGVLYTNAGDYGIIRDCVLYGNQDGIKNNGKACLMSNLLSYENTRYGLLIPSGGPTALVNNATIADNGADGIKATDGAIRDSIVTGNGEYGILGGSGRVITYCDVWNNTLGDYSGGCSAGEGCISSNPLYTDAANDDYSLQATSPCKGADTDGGDMGYTYPAPYTNVAPVCDAGPDVDEAHTTQMITFDGSGAYDPNNDPITLTWEMGDGTTLTGTTVTHTYTATGTYTVTLTVTDGSLSDSDTAKVEVYVELYCDSIAAEDGFVRESDKDSNEGGLVDSTGTFKIGDHNGDKQCKGFMSFDTSGVDDSATVYKATLTFRRSGGYGQPENLGDLVADIKSGYFGTSASLESGDWEASADADAVSTLSFPEGGGDYAEGDLDSTGRSYVNKTGKTQLRARFTIKYEEDGNNDYIACNDGSEGSEWKRPKLRLLYR